MNDMVQAIKLPWDRVSECISLEVSKILGRRIICKATMDDYDYWAIQLSEKRIPMSELFKLMETVGADEAARKDSLPESTIKVTSIKEIGMGVSELLLSRHLHYKWVLFHIDANHLWLLDIKEAGNDEASH